MSWHFFLGLYWISFNEEFLLTRRKKLPTAYLAQSPMGLEVRTVFVASTPLSTLYVNYLSFVELLLPQRRWNKSVWRHTSNKLRWPPVFWAHSSKGQHCQDGMLLVRGTKPVARGFTALLRRNPPIKAIPLKWLKAPQSFLCAWAFMM